MVPWSWKILVQTISQSAGERRSAAMMFPRTAIRTPPPPQARSLRFGWLMVYSSGKMELLWIEGSSFVSQPSITSGLYVSMNWQSCKCLSWLIRLPKLITHTRIWSSFLANGKSVECSDLWSDLELDDIEFCDIYESALEKPWAGYIGEWWTVGAETRCCSVFFLLARSGVEWSGLKVWIWLASLLYSSESDKMANLFVSSRLDKKNDEVKLGRSQLQHIQTYDGCCLRILKLTLLMARQRLWYHT